MLFCNLLILLFLLYLNAIGLFQLQCEPSEYKYRYHFELLNGVSHLEAHQLPLPALYTLFAVLYALILLVWLLMWQRHAFARYYNHSHLTVLLALKLTAVLAMALYWRRRSSKGDFELELLLAVTAAVFVQVIFVYFFRFRNKTTNNCVSVLFLVFFF